MTRFLGTDYIKQFIAPLPQSERNHMIRVGLMVGILIEKFPQINSDQKAMLKKAAFYHDIGKRHVPASILLKEGKLTPEEMEIVKLHPLYGQAIFYEMRTSHHSEFADEFYQQAVNCTLYHHERWDGQGYPFGLQALQIPFTGRITSVCDSYDAITNARPYHHGRTHEQACMELRRCSGTQFDPMVVKVFLASEAELMAAICSLQDENRQNVQTMGFRTQQSAPTFVHQRK